MSEPGWYPDPGGRPGHYRFWDGQAWGLGTTSELPGGAGATGGTGGSTATGRTGSRALRVGLAATAAAVVLVLVAVGALVLRERGRAVVDPSPGPSAPVTTSATPSPSASPTPLPSTSPSASPSSPSDPVPSGRECPLGDPLTRQDHPQDGRVHGGGLSFRPPRSWSQDSRSAALSWAYDVGAADEQVRGTWFTGAAVGALSVVDAPDLESAAELVVGCTATPSFYTDVTSRTDLVNEPARFEGRRAWTVRSEIRMDNPSVDVPGDVLEVVVVDLGSPESFAFFWGTAPLDDPALIARLDTVTQGLRTD